MIDLRKWLTDEIGSVHLVMESVLITGRFGYEEGCAVKMM